AIQLAHDGIPADGARNLLRHDPMTQGPRLFKENCASCHDYNGPPKETPDRKATASDLAGFGTRDWIAGLLTDAAAPQYYGRTHLKNGRMSRFVTEQRNKNDPKIAEDFDTVAEWLAGHPRGTQPSTSRGAKVFNKRCARCHSYEGQGGGEPGSAPDLTGYGDAEWLRLMIMSPDHPQRYGTRNRMPGFRDLE